MSLHSIRGDVGTLAALEYTFADVRPFAAQACSFCLHRPALIGPASMVAGLHSWSEAIQSGGRRPKYGRPEKLALGAPVQRQCPGEPQSKAWPASGACRNCSGLAIGGGLPSPRGFAIFWPELSHFPPVRRQSSMDANSSPTLRLPPSWLCKWRPCAAWRPPLRGFMRPNNRKNLKRGGRAN